jgi:hypothetical protein|tara:strand:- start:116 stop:421 length:306 start_codon:yes stop_codon:yes gene_type:complete
MKQIKLTITLLIFIVLAGCGIFSDVGKVMRNEKTGNTDEFLIKKREPLTQPPDFHNLPEPNTNKNIEQKKITEILKKGEKIKQQNKIRSSTEQSIIEQIKQ